MINFVIITTISLFLSLSIFKKFDSSLLFICGMSLTLLILFGIGFRSATSGTDTQTYIDIFESVNSNSDVEKQFEPGFFVFLQLMVFLSNATGFIFSITLFTVLSLWLSATYIGIKNNALFVTAFFCLLPGFDLLTNGVRNGLALSLFLLIFVLQLQRNWIKKLLLLIPALMHFSVLLPFILSVLNFVNSKSVYKFLCYISIGFVVLFSVTQFNAYNLANENASDYGPIVFAVIKYLSVEDAIFNPAVKLYFGLVFITLTALNVSQYQSSINCDSNAIAVFKISCWLGLVTAVLWFTNYSYRFFYLAFPFQLLFAIYMFENKMKFWLRGGVALGLIISLLTVLFRDSMTKFVFFGAL